MRSLRWIVEGLEATRRGDAGLVVMDTEQSERAESGTLGLADWVCRLARLRRREVQRRCWQLESVECVRWTVDRAGLGVEATTPTRLGEWRRRGVDSH